MKKLVLFLIMAAALFLIMAAALLAAVCSCSGTQTDIGSKSDGDAAVSEVEIMYIYIYDNRLEARLADNESARALASLLAQGDITYTADDYGNFEKVGGIGRTLPRCDEYISVSAGDVILYQGSNICLYYGTNSWNFTRIAQIVGYSSDELRELLGAGRGSTQVRLSLS